jgi:hypothetical protein
MTSLDFFWFLAPAELERIHYKEEGVFITSRIWRGKHNSLSREEQLCYQGYYQP